MARFLRDDLADDDRHAVEGHIAACPDCPAILERLNRAVLPPEVDDALRGLSAATPPIPGIELLEPIGRGGSGTVWKGRLRESQQLVAVKVVVGGASAAPAQLDRFRREIDILSRLNHPHLVRLFHAGPIADGHFFSMEYLPNGSILDVRRRQAQEGLPGVWPVRRVAEAVRTIAGGIEHAHRAGVLHRDLKPGNILLDPDGQPKVADFSLGKLIDATTTSSGRGGTPCYMAPEQVRGDAQTTHTDVYGLGAVLYDLLTGRPPVPDGSDTPEVLYRAVHGEVVSPHILRPDVPADLERVCLKCLEKDPRHRYATAAAVADDLGRFLDGKPVSVRPLDPLSAALRKARRHPLQAALVVTLALAIAGGLTAGVFAVRSARSEADALRERNQRMARERAIGDLLLSSGSLRESVRLTDEMVAEGYELTPRQRLHRAETLLELGDHGRATADVEALTGDAAPAILRGRIHLVRAGLLLGRDDVAARRWIDAARAEPHLAPSDAAFADALVADTTPEAIRHLERAVGLESRHIPAQSLRCVLLLLGGRLDDAVHAADQCRLLFVDHPTFPTVLALAHGFQGNHARAKHALEALAPLRPPEEVDVLRELVGVLSFAQTELRVRIFGEADGPEPPSPPVRARTVAAIGRASRFAAEVVTEMRLPPKLRPAIEVTFGYVRRIFINAPTDTGGRLIPREALDDYAEVIRRHPEGVATMLYAMGRLESANSYNNRTHPDQFRAELARSAAAFRTATTLPSWIGVRDIALENAAVFYSVAGKPNWSPPVTVNDPWVAAGADAARERWQAGPITPRMLGKMIRISATAGRFSIARAMLDDLERAIPNEPDIDRARADLEFKAGNYAAALTAAEKYLRAVPDHDETTRIRDECRRRLK